MKLSEKQQYILSQFFISIITILMLIGFLSGLKDQNIDLLKTDKKVGKVENFETETYTRNKGIKSTDFYIKLEDFEKKFKVGRVFSNYNDLIQTINKGDSLIIYCIENKNDFTVIEICKSNELILDKNEFEKQSTLVLIITFLGLITCIYLIYKIRKHYLKTNSNR